MEFQAPKPLCHLTLCLVAVNVDEMVPQIQHSWELPLVQKTQKQEWNLDADSSKKLKFY